MHNIHIAVHNIHIAVLDIYIAVNNIYIRKFQTTDYQSQRKSIIKEIQSNKNVPTTSCFPYLFQYAFVSSSSKQENNPVLPLLSQNQVRANPLLHHPDKAHRASL